MHLTHLSLADFRSYTEVDVALEPGVTAFVGPNGQGKTNLVEAIDFVARLASHRVAGDAPLVRLGADHAVVRALVVRDGREATVRRVLRGPHHAAAELLDPRDRRIGVAHGEVDRQPRRDRDEDCRNGAPFDRVDDAQHHE